MCTKSIVIILLSVVFTSCSNSLNEADLQAYIQNPNHSLTQQQTAASATITCTYRPAALLLAQELARAPTLVSQVDSLRGLYAGKSYFTLSLAQNGTEIENQFITDQTTYTNALAYLNTGIASDVFLVTAARDSIPALASIYPRQYGTTGRSTMLLIFDTQAHPLTQDFTLTFHDRQFGLGTLRFPFRAADLAAVPELKL